MERVSDDGLEKVVGGFMQMRKNSNIMSYTHSDGSVTTHIILDFDLAWEMKNELSAQGYDEDYILQKLIDMNYIQE